jgi:hypothetical protein
MKDENSLKRRSQTTESAIKTGFGPPRSMYSVMHPGERVKKVDDKFDELRQAISRLRKVNNPEPMGPRRALK